MSPSYSFGGFRKFSGMADSSPSPGGKNKFSNSLSKSASMANISRFKNPRKIIPGPGEYEINRDDLGGNSGFTVGTLRVKSFIQSPGPGEYKTNDSSFPKKGVYMGKQVKYHDPSRGKPGPG